MMICTHIDIPDYVYSFFLENKADELTPEEEMAACLIEYVKWLIEHKP